MNRIKVITSDNHADKRGLIWTSWKKNNINLNFEHDKFSFSKKNVLRGLHYDDKTWKLISCPFGKIFFVVVKQEIEDFPPPKDLDIVKISGTKSLYCIK